jgi:hypothetical protein
MKTALLGLILTGGVAAASPTPMVHAPDGWRTDAEQAASIAKAAGAAKPFGDPAAVVAAEVYGPVNDTRISLVVTRASTRDAKLDRGTAAAAAIEDVHGTSARAKLSGAKPVEDGWDRGVTADQTLEASLAWHDSDANTKDLIRIVIAADAATLTAVTGECLASADAQAPTIAACKAALATLDPGIAKSDRIAIPAPSLVSVPLPDSSSPQGSDHLVLPMAHMTDGSRVELPPMAIPRDAPSDRRPVYVGAGIALLAAAFYWNRRNRERFGPEPDAGKDKLDDR